MAGDCHEAGRKRTYTDAFEMVVWDRHDIFPATVRKSRIGTSTVHVKGVLEKLTAKLQNTRPRLRDIKSMLPQSRSQ